ncbi:hypothetical protein II906_06810 [bacterium]|nr:hypothetical protein [bacterium]
MQISNVSFKGLWELKAPKLIACEPNSSFFGPVYSQKMIYHPFRNEKDSEIDKAVSEYKGKLFGFIDSRDEDPYGYEKVFAPEVKIGARLGLTLNEYKRILSFQNIPLPHKTFDEYTVLQGETEKRAKNIMLNYQV